ncbi:MAG: bifunctional methylenetetrahydrofolate dehydrogenase/methenyltetrahydrofolate cyclohydrolase FolD [Deltaproteobacteria bacterium]|nr:bifunctional methylenetetrahydrofolate dehydrogenase/methenyltetrahydrofolate cyclohydrolase FolD [Deltaproteobacteria bacterium]
MEPESGALVIDGKAIAKRLRESIQVSVKAVERNFGAPPHLAVVLASADPASAVYVRNKERAALEVGIRTTQHTLPAETSREALLALIDRLNADSSIDGILVQLPLPEQHDVNEIIERIDPLKDVDGLHPLNAGKLARGNETGLIPCTPHGVILLLASVETPLEGARAVVIGRSRLVGKPVADLLTNRNATVTLCHSRTKQLAALVGEADILVAAIGRSRFVHGDWIKPGAVVIDVGTNRGDDGKLVGDVEFDVARTRARAITPVPGGVGPLTIASLLRNTLLAAHRRR